MNPVYILFGLAGVAGCGWKVYRASQGWPVPILGFGEPLPPARTSDGRAEPNVPGMVLWIIIGLPWVGFVIAGLAGVE